MNVEPRPGQGVAPFFRLLGKNTLSQIEFLAALHNPNINDYTMRFLVQHAKSQKQRLMLMNHPQAGYRVAEELADSVKTINDSDDLLKSIVFSKNDVDADLIISKIINSDIFINTHHLHTLVHHPKSGILTALAVYNHPSADENIRKHADLLRNKPRPSHRFRP